MCVVGAQREKIWILTAVLQLSRLTSKDLLCPRKSIEEEEEERRGVRHGSFSGKVIFSVDSHTAFLKCPSLDLPIVSDSGVSCLTPVLAVTRGLPSGLVIST